MFEKFKIRHIPKPAEPQMYGMELWDDLYVVRDLDGNTTLMHKDEFDRKFFRA